MSVRFIFTADSHLRNASMGSTERGEDFFKALQSVVDAAVKHKVTDILHGGDILDATRLSSRVSDQLQEIDLMCRERGIKMHVISGNHDACKPHWIESIKKMRESLGDTEEGGIFLVDNCVVEIAGSAKGETMRVLALPSMNSDAFLQCAAAREADILMWHGAIREFCGYPDPSALSIEDLPLDRFDAILLGDIHIRRFETVRNCLVGYPGATEVARTNDPLDCTCTLMEWTKGSPPKILENIPVNCRPMFPRRIDSEEKMTSVLAELRKLKNKPAMFLVRYVDVLENVAERLKLAAGANTLVRSQAYTLGDSVSLASVFGASVADMEHKPAEAFLVGLVPPGSELATAAALLLNPLADHSSILSTLVQRLENPQPITA